MEKTDPLAEALDIPQEVLAKLASKVKTQEDLDGSNGRLGGSSGNGEMKDALISPRLGRVKVAHRFRPLRRSSGLRLSSTLGHMLSFLGAFRRGR